MKDKNLVVVEKMLEEIVIAQAFMNNVDLDEFLTDEKLKRATCMTVINLGELTKNLDDDFRAAHSIIPWKAIAGFRDIAAHKYQTLHMADVYTTVTFDFDSLRQKLSDILS